MSVEIEYRQLDIGYRNADTLVSIVSGLVFTIKA